MFTGPVGTGQIHDYNPHIDTNGLFWTMFVPNGAVDVHLGSGRASFQLTTPIADDHDLKSSLTRVFPPGYPQTAEVTFDVQWSNVLDRQHIRNADMGFEGDFLKTDSTIEWRSTNPATGFQFTSEPANPSRTLYAVIGHERNGVFFR